MAGPFTYTGDKRGHYGTAAVLNKKLGKLVETSVNRSNRVMGVKLKVILEGLVIIQVNMATGQHSDEKKKDMFE